MERKRPLRDMNCRIKSSDEIADFEISKKNMPKFIGFNGNVYKNVAVWFDKVWIFEIFMGFTRGENTT